MIGFGGASMLGETGVSISGVSGASILTREHEDWICLGLRSVTVKKRKLGVESVEEVLYERIVKYQRTCVCE